MVVTGVLAAPWVRYTEATECSDAELSALAELTAPAGMTVEPYGSVAAGCIADPASRLAPEQVHEHYRAEFAEHGWEPARPDSGGVAAAKDGIGVDVFAEPREGRVFITVWDGSGDRTG